MAGALLRRRLAVGLLIMLAACATPPVRLSPVYRAGEIRTYQLEATSRTDVDVAGERRREVTVLRARSVIEVLGLDGEEATVRLQLVGEAFTRDGRDLEPPAEQVAELVLGPDGGLAGAGQLAQELRRQERAELGSQEQPDGALRNKRTLLSAPGPTFLAAPPRSI